MDLFGDYWQGFLNWDGPINGFLMEVGRKPDNWLVAAISKLHISPEYGCELGFYDIEFVDGLPHRWRAKYFYFPDEIDKAFDALVELSMTHNLIGVNSTRGDMMFEESGNHQTNIGVEVVETFFNRMRKLQTPIDESHEM